MQILLLLTFSCLSGVFAGMGMGGGTFLIPLLSLIFGIKQTVCQSTNVLCFIVLSVLCFVVYVKNKLIDFKAMFCIGLPAAIMAFFASFFALKIESNLLQILFSCFIILVGIFYFVKAVFDIKKSQK